MLTRNEYLNLVRKLRGEGYEQTFSVMDDAGTGGVYFERSTDGAAAAIRCGVIEYGAQPT